MVCSRWYLLLRVLLVYKMLLIKADCVFFCYEGSDNPLLRFGGDFAHSIIAARIGASEVYWNEFKEMDPVLMFYEYFRDAWPIFTPARFGHLYYTLYYIMPVTDEYLLIALMGFTHSETQGDLFQAITHFRPYVKNALFRCQRELSSEREGQEGLL